jgi:DNA-binding transcriptional LysR family regulator
VNAPLGFGQSYIGPAISQFNRQYPDVEIQLHLTVIARWPADDATDIAIRFGRFRIHGSSPRRSPRTAGCCAPRPPTCAPPAARRIPQELSRHQCIVLRQNESAYGSWKLSRGRQTETVKVQGKLSTNDGKWPSTGRWTATAS